MRTAMCARIRLLSRGRTRSTYASTMSRSSNRESGEVVSDSSNNNASLPALWPPSEMARHGGLPVVRETRTRTRRERNGGLLGGSPTGFKVRFIMPTYISLINYTQRGIEEIKDSPNRLQAAKEAVRAAGGELKEFSYLAMAGSTR